MAHPRRREGMQCCAGEPHSMSENPQRPPLCCGVPGNPTDLKPRAQDPKAMGKACEKSKHLRLFPISKVPDIIEVNIKVRTLLQL